MNEYEPYDQILRHTTGTLRIGRPRTHEGLCVLPLLSISPCAARYVLLEQALERGTMLITEVNEAGQVPYLTAVNKGPWPVLIFDGEELIGAKQNRICNATILVGVGKSVLPVSCVEQGRWSRKSASFSGGSYTSHPSLRMEKEFLVRRYAAAATAASDRAHHETQAGPANEAPDGRTGEGPLPGGAAAEPQQARAARYLGAQHEVWAEVARVSDRLNVRSHTSALADNYKNHGRQLEEYIKALDLDDDPATRDMVAAMVFIDGRYVCTDFLQPAKRFHRLYPKLLNGYALEALVSANSRDFWATSGERGAHPNEHPRPGDDSTSRDNGRHRGNGHDREDGPDGCIVPPRHAPDFDPEAYALRLLADIRAAEIHYQTSADLGEDLRLQTRGLSGSGLIWSGELIQLSLFPCKAA
jgi:hypothetical protein